MFQSSGLFRSIYGHLGWIFLPYCFNESSSCLQFETMTERANLRARSPLDVLIFLSFLKSKIGDNLTRLKWGALEKARVSARPDRLHFSANAAERFITTAIKVSTFYQPIGECLVRTPKTMSECHLVYFTWTLAPWGDSFKVLLKGSCQQRKRITNGQANLTMGKKH